MSGARTRWRVATLVVAPVALAALATPVAAHGGFDSRFDAPLPLGVVYGGAAVTVLFTAFLASERRPGELDRRLLTVPGAVARPLRAVARVGVPLAVAVALLHGVVGPRNYVLNGATLVVWPLLIVGVALYSILLGSPWRLVSPWRAVHDLLSRLEGRELALADYPAWLGRWPALVGYVALVGVIANLTRVPFDPAATATVVAVYGLVTVVGAVAFGRAWLDRADPLAVLFDLFGRAAPLGVERVAADGREADGGGDGAWTVRTRAPWLATARPVPDVATAAFVVAAVYTVTFDGFVGTPPYEGVYAWARTATGLGPAASVPLYVAGLVGFLAAFAGAATLVARRARARRDRAPATARGGRRAGDGGTDRGPASDGGSGADARTASRVDGGAGATTALAGSLLPIAAGYEVAHNWTYVLTVLGRLPGAIPVVDLPTVDLLGPLPVVAVWATQVGLIVLGHVVAVLSAHEATARLLGPDADPRAAFTAHAPLAVAMVGYTVVSLWVVSLPAG